MSVRLYILSFFILITQIAQSQRTDVKIKSVLISKIAEQVEWPSYGDSAVFTVAIMEEESVMYDLLKVQKNAFRKVAGSREVRIVITDRKDIALKSDLLYLSKEYFKIAEKIYALDSKHCPLIVTDESPELYFSMINFTTVDNTVKFGINKANLVEKGFAISEKLVLLGGTEIDIRKLYVKAQEQLKEEHAKLALEQKKFANLKVKVREKEDELHIKQKQYDTLLFAKNDIENLLVEEKNKLNASRKRIVTLNSQFIQKSKSLKEREIMLSKLEEQIRVEKQEIEYNQQKIEYLNTAINQKKILVEQQDELLEKQGEQLNNSRVIIYAVSVVSFILLLLSVFFYRLNQYKKQTNQKLADLNQDLTQKNEMITEQKEQIEQQNEVLAFQNKRLDEGNSTKDKFFSIIAHDLKNPVNTIKGFSELLELRKDKLTEEKRNLFYKQIADSSNNLSEILDNLLDWARSQSDRITYNPVKTELDGIVERNVKFIESTARKKNIKIITQLSGNIMLNVDINMTDTILRNILSNAIKFSYRDNKIVLNCQRYNKEFVQFSVVDFGAGMSKDRQKKLFHIENTESTLGTEEERGTGLGLVICQEFVQKHNGKIWISSVEGEGSTVSFTLPAVFNDDISLSLEEFTQD